MKGHENVVKTSQQRFTVIFSCGILVRSDFSVSAGFLHYVLLHQSNLKQQSNLHERYYTIDQHVYRLKEK